MKRELGFARCGLACCVCHENVDCPGCHADGCKDKDWCKNRLCSIKKGIESCMVCGEYPCEGGMLAKPRIRGFADYIRKYGADRLMDCLERNEKAGVQYHYPDQIVGDYDRFKTREELWSFIETGVQPNSADVSVSH